MANVTFIETKLFGVIATSRLKGEQAITLKNMYSAKYTYSVDSYSMVCLKPSTFMRIRRCIGKFETSARNHPHRASCPEIP